MPENLQHSPGDDSVYFFIRVCHSQVSEVSKKRNVSIYMLFYNIQKYLRGFCGNTRIFITFSEATIYWKNIDLSKVEMEFEVEMPENLFWIF